MVLVMNWSDLFFFNDVRVDTVANGRLVTENVIIIIIHVIG